MQEHTSCRWKVLINIQHILTQNQVPKMLHVEATITFCLGNIHLAPLNNFQKKIFHFLLLPVIDFNSERSVCRVSKLAF